MKHTSVHNLKLLQFESFPSDSLFHFTTTTERGVSEGNYSSFNLGFYSGDSKENVSENRDRLTNAVGISPRNFFVPYQTHDDKICIIDQDFLSMTDEDQSLSLNGIDALITDQKKIGIGITTADCVPLLIYDPIKKVFAAIHGGWKGTAARIGYKTAQRMIDHFGCNPSDLVVGIGPSISPECFEVGDEVGKVFTDAGFELSEISYRNILTGKLHIDLWEANRLPLIDIGILPQNIEVSQICTYSNSDLLFSARRQTIHSGRIVTGGVIR